MNTVQYNVFVEYIVHVIQSKSTEFNSVLCMRPFCKVLFVTTCRSAPDPNCALCCDLFRLSRTGGPWA